MSGTSTRCRGMTALRRSSTPRKWRRRSAISGVRCNASGANVDGSLSASWRLDRMVPPGATSVTLWASLGKQLDSDSMATGAKRRAAAPTPDRSSRSAPITLPAVYRGPVVAERHRPRPRLQRNVAHRGYAQSWQNSLPHRAVGSGIPAARYAWKRPPRAVPRPALGGFLLRFPGVSTFESRPATSL